MGTAWDTSPSSTSPKAQRAKQSWEEHEFFLLGAIIILCFCINLCKSQNFIWKEGKTESLGSRETPLLEGWSSKEPPLWGSFAEVAQRDGGCGGRGQDGAACDRRARQPDRRTDRQTDQRSAPPAFGRWDRQSSQLAAFLFSFHFFVVVASLKKVTRHFPLNPPTVF